MAKIKLVNPVPETTVHLQYHYWCLGCGYVHAFKLKQHGGHHTFNMDLDKPTVSPSLVQNFTPGRMCHSFIKDGFIQYLGDCWHHLKGKTVELPETDDHFQ